MRYIEGEHGNTNIEIRKGTWRTFCHMLRLLEKTPCQMAMTDTFEIRPNSKRYH